MPDTSPVTERLVRVGTLAELEAKGRIVVQGRDCPLLVVRDGERIFAVDNRCPHLGFPLHRGSVEDGIVTCHWHHARFDLASGGGFDLWADDLATATVRIEHGEVWVAAEARYPDGAAHWRNRLAAGMAHNIGLVIAKSILGRLGEGAAPRELLRDAALFGVRHRDGWDTGLTVMTALGNLIDGLPEDERYLALYKGISGVAADCDGAAMRRPLRPLEGAAPDPATLARWLRHWTAVRHRDGAERTLRTAIAGGAAPGALAAMMLAAVTDRVFADGGHALDFINKAFECLDLVGWEHASELLPATVGLLVAARGAEESNAWRHPVDLIVLCAEAARALPAALAAGAARRGSWRDHAALADALLGDEPAPIVAALIAAIHAGATTTDLGRALAYAAALRVARFGTANEHSDWDAAHHAFTYCHALHRLLARIAAAGQPTTPELCRGVLHGAMRVYLLRFLNVPPARLPGETSATLDDLPPDARALGAAFLDALDRQGSVEAAARPIARHFALGHKREALTAVLAGAVLREDAGFHTYQMLEAGIEEARAWGEGPEARRILSAVARFLAAHSPTARADLQTATVARKLAHGQALHEEKIEP